MSVSTRLMSNGQFDIQLHDVPNSVIDSLPWYATVVVTDPAVDEQVLRADYQLFPNRTEYPGAAVYTPRNTMYEVARYSGVLIKASKRSIRGYGLAWLLGDTESGEPYTDAILFGGVPLSQVIPRLLPQAILPGTIHDTTDVFVGSVGQYQLPKPALEYVSQVMRTEWRINPDATLDAGSEAQLFSDVGDLPHPGAAVYPAATLFPQSIVPAAIAVAEAYAGTDVSLQTLAAASMEAEFDVEDYATGALVVGENLDSALVETDSPYRDPHGNPIRRIKIISDPDTDAANLVQRATVEAGNLAETRTAVTLSVNDYVITNTDGEPAPADVGTTIWVYDPDEGLFDVLNPVAWRGQTVYPVALRVLGATWPVTSEMGVYVRDTDGSWIDLTAYLAAEPGAATLEVGATRRTLINLNRQREAFRTRIAVTA